MARKIMENLVKAHPRPEVFVGSLDEIQSKAGHYYLSVDKAGDDVTISAHSRVLDEVSHTVTARDAMDKNFVVMTIEDYVTWEQAMNEDLCDVLSKEATQAADWLESLENRRVLMGIGRDG